MYHAIVLSVYYTLSAQLLLSNCASQSSAQSVLFKHSGIPGYILHKSKSVQQGYSEPWIGSTRVSVQSEYSNTGPDGTHFSVQSKYSEAGPKSTHVSVQQGYSEPERYGTPERVQPVNSEPGDSTHVLPEYSVVQQNKQHYKRAAQNKYNVGDNLEKAGRMYIIWRLKSLESIK